MGLLDRFRKKKEQEMKTAVPAALRAVKKSPEVPKSAAPIETKKAMSPRVGKSHLADRILLRPIVTEKSASLAADNKYIFEVPVGTTALVVRLAVSELYGVKPLKVNMINRRGESVRFGRIKGREKRRRRAIVTLEKGKTLDIYAGV